MGMGGKTGRDMPCMYCRYGMRDGSDVVYRLALLCCMYICTRFVDRIRSPGLSRFGIFGKLRKGQAAEKADGIDGQLARKDDCSRSGWFSQRLGTS